ncbi:MAG: DUF5681 domain-containing protein [Sphingobium sp.]
MIDDDDLPFEAGEEEPPFEVGYGKPPEEHRFKKGNKQGKGRPRGSRNLKTCVREALEAKVPAKINGKTRKVSKIELAMHQLANKASKGELKAIDKATALYERYGPPEEDGPIPDDEQAYDIETLRHHLKIQGETGDE